MALSSARYSGYIVCICRKSAVVTKCFATEDLWGLCGRVSTATKAVGCLLYFILEKWVCVFGSTSFILPGFEYFVTLFRG